MKKILTLLLALLMIFALCACGDDGEDTVGYTEVGGVDTSELQIGNPMVVVDGPENIAASIGAPVAAPDGAENVAYCVIGGIIGEVEFDYDGIRYNCRVFKSDELRDVSGLYFTQPKLCDTDADARIVMETNASIGNAIWYDGGYSYSVSVVKDATPELLAAMYSLVAGK